MKIAHLSDLHFSKVSFTFHQLFSKRWLGNLNLIFSRKKAFDTERLFLLIDLFKQQKIEHVIITGDLSTTSLRSEFEQAKAFIKALEDAEIKTHVLPGNHDHYTKKAYREKLFYNYFPSPLQEQGVCKTSLGPGWWLISLDTALATPLFSSRGHFTTALEKALTEALDSIPATDRILIANHFPLFENDGPRKVMMRAHALKTLMRKYPNIAFYLHGHTHRHSAADLRSNHLPIVLESGSPSLKERGTWHLLDIDSKEFQLKIFHYDDTQWSLSKHLSFTP
jgi:3',5'-cyclic AMP phosphodiesterase CpdA